MPGGRSALALAVLLSCAAPPSVRGDPDQASGPEADSAGRQAPWFVEITEQVRLDFTHDAGLDGGFFFPEIMAAGAAVLDYNNDGRLDVYFINSGPHGERARKLPPAPNRLFRQEADGTFTDVTAESGLGDAGYGMGVTVGDIDNDGHADVFITNYGLDALYRNNGDGTFTNVTKRAGIGGSQWSTSACFLDYNRNGYLDLYVATYVHDVPGRKCHTPAGQPDYCGPLTFNGTPDVLYRNNGDGTFTDASLETGLGRTPGRGLGVICADLTEDGWPDVYVANDGEENFLWVNQGDGRFVNEALVRGAAVNLFGKPEASMGVALGDVTGSGRLDLFVTHLTGETNTLYRNLGNGLFEDGTALSGLGPASLPWTGFGTAFFDANHDGHLDLLVVNGAVRRKEREALRGAAERTVEQAWLEEYGEPNQFFTNEGRGVFRDASALAGELTQRVEVSRGLVMADVDGDGALDVLLTNGHGPARLFRNVAPKEGHWLQLRLFDPALNRDAIGSSVRLRAGGREFVQVLSPSFSYLASNPFTLHFGLGAPERADRVTVRWWDGSCEAFPGLAAGRTHRVDKGSGTPCDED